MSLLWLSPYLSLLAYRAHIGLNTAHFTNTPTFLLIIYHTLINVHTQCHTNTVRYFKQYQVLTNKYKTCYCMTHIFNF